MFGACGHYRDSERKYKNIKKLKKKKKVDVDSSFMRLFYDFDDENYLLGIFIFCLALTDWT